MSHPLQQRIHALRSRVVRLLAIRGLSVMVAAVLATVIALGWIDYWVRFRDRGVLVVFAVAVLGVFAWTGYLAVRRLLLLKTRLGDTDVALHVEACFPAVKDRLASAVEFLRQPEDDAVAGSAAMRRAAIAQAAAASEDLDFDAALDRRPALRSALAALVVGLLAAFLAASRRGGGPHGLGPPGISAGHGRLAPENAPGPAAAGQAHRHRPRSAVGGRSDRHERCPAAARLPHPLSSCGCPRKDARRNRADAIVGQVDGRAARKRDVAAGVPLYRRRRSEHELDRSPGHRPARAARGPLADAQDHSSRLHELARGRARGDLDPAALGRLARATCRQSDQDGSSRRASCGSTTAAKCPSRSTATA